LTTPESLNLADDHAKMNQPSMLSIIGRHFYRLVFGDPEREEQRRAEEAARIAWSEAHPWPKSLEDFPWDPSKPYGGQPVPKEALLEGVEPNGKFLHDWHERWQMVLAENGCDVLVFSVLFVAELETGEVIYDEDDRRAEDWPSGHGRRLAETIRIHERLEDGGERCKRVMGFLGSAPSCYRIENLLPNGFCHEVASRSKQPDKILALHQRWTLQYLSACRYIHSKSIVINAPPDECAWLRSDLSLAVAGFVDASCRELEIRAGCWESSTTYCSPFSPHNASWGSDAYDYGEAKRIFSTGLVGCINLWQMAETRFCRPGKNKGRMVQTRCLQEKEQSKMVCTNTGRSRPKINWVLASSRRGRENMRLLMKHSRMSEPC
jgi:hypothetical protein